MNTSLHAQKDIDYHKVIAHEYDRVVVAPRILINNAAFGRFSSLVKCGRKMLDLGCGTGHMFLRFGERFSEICAVDHSEAMLNQAQLKASKLNMNKVNFQQSQALDYLASCKDGDFDLICCTGFLHHLRCDDTREVLLEVSRVLNSSGIALFQEPIQIDPKDIPKQINKWNSGSVAGTLVYSVPVEEPDEQPLELAFFLEVVKNAGLQVVGTNRNWEIFPKTLPSTWIDRLFIRYLNLRYGGTGNVLTLAARPSSHRV